MEFGPGVRSVIVPISIADDSRTEPAETFRVVLSEPSGSFQLGDVSEAVVTILDDDRKYTQTSLFIIIQHLLVI